MRQPRENPIAREYSATAGAAPGRERTCRPLPIPAAHASDPKLPFRGVLRAPLCDTTSRRPALSCRRSGSAERRSHLDLPALMSGVEAARAPNAAKRVGDLLDHAETHHAGQPRRRHAMTGPLPPFAKATRVTEPHLGPRRSARHCALVRRTRAVWVSRLTPLDLLAHRRLVQVEPFSARR